MRRTLDRRGAAIRGVRAAGAGRAGADGGRDQRAVPRPLPALRARARLRQRDGDGDRARARQRQDRADDHVRSRRAPAQPAALRLGPADDGPCRRQRVRRRASSTTSTSTSAARRPRSRARAAAPPCRPGRRCCGRSSAPPSAPPTPYGVPVTAKFRIGLHDGLLTHLRAGAICADEGVVAIAVHARTVEQHYAGDARWDAIAELKAHVTSIPVLGNGDIWEAVDAVAMMRATGLRRRRRRARLPRPAVAVRRPHRGARGPPGAAAATARHRARR